MKPGIVNSMGNVQKIGTGKDMFSEFVSGRIEKAHFPTLSQGLTCIPLTTYHL